jgi:hypothetical protein
MKHSSELETTLSEFFDWNKARIYCLIQILQGLFCVRTINLTQIATAFQTDAKEASAYRRIRRFFATFSFDVSLIVSLILRIFPLEGKFLLILDRTNWKWGKTPINILMLSVAYQGISIPLFWASLDREGASAPDDRIPLLKRVLEKFGLDKIEALVADREFVGKKWFQYLVESKIPFVIRIKDRFLADGIREGYPVPIRELCKQLGRKRKLVNHQVVLWGYELFISIRWGKNAREPMVVVSNFKFGDPLGLYKRRWGIETLFGCLKTRGFRMEDTHMTDGDRIEKLVFILAIAFCWAYRLGELQEQLSPIAVKTHGRKEKSVFRAGMDLIRGAVLKVARNSHLLRQLLKCFSPLKSTSCYA